MAYNTAKGFDTSKLDQSAVKEAQRGSQWDSNDQKRYDAIMRARQQKSAPKQQKQSNERKPGPAGTPTLVPPKGPVTSSNKTVNQSISGPAPSSKPSGLGSQAQSQNVTQDNDINTTINGNNNKVFNEQDNSIRQYGGDNRTFVYNASQQGDGFSKYEQTPVSAATMSGFYAPDDSPAAQAKFTDLHSTLNADRQKRYAGDAMKVANKYMMDARDYTPQSMENYLNRSIQYSYDKSDVQTGSTFGDIWNPNFITEDWQMPDAPKAIESNASKIAKDAKEDIEDI